MTRDAPIPRHSLPQVIEALADTMIVTVEGPRQAGKSTLCEIVAAERRMRVVTLDDPTARRAANDDPSGFIAGLGERAFIDELQRAPDLALALKAEVDRDRRPGAVPGEWLREPAARAHDWRFAGRTGRAGSATSLFGRLCTFRGCDLRSRRV